MAIPAFSASGIGGLTGVAGAGGDKKARRNTVPMTPGFGLSGVGTKELLPPGTAPMPKVTATPEAPQPPLTLPEGDVNLGAPIPAQSLIPGFGIPGGAGLTGATPEQAPSATPIMPAPTAPAAPIGAVPAEPMSATPTRAGISPFSLGLMAAGLSMMAEGGRSRPIEEAQSGLGIVGKAGLAGLGTYAEAAKQEREAAKAGKLVNIEDPYNKEVHAYVSGTPEYHQAVSAGGRVRGFGREGESVPQRQTPTTLALAVAKGSIPGASDADVQAGKEAKAALDLLNQQKLDTGRMAFLREKERQGKSLAQMLVDNEMAPSELDSVQRAAAIAEAKRIDPSYNAAKANAMQNKVKGVTFQNQYDGFLSFLDPNEGLLARADEVRQRMYSVEPTVLNKIARKFNAGLSDFDASELNALTTLFGEEGARVFAGGRGGIEVMKYAAGLLNPDLTKEAFSNKVSAIKRASMVWLKQRVKDTTLESSTKSQLADWGYSTTDWDGAGKKSIGGVPGQAPAKAGATWEQGADGVWRRK